MPGKQDVKTSATADSLALCVQSAAHCGDRIGAPVQTSSRAALFLPQQTSLEDSIQFRRFDPYAVITNTDGSDAVDHA